MAVKSFQLKKWQRAKRAQASAKSAAKSAQIARQTAQQATGAMTKWKNAQALKSKWSQSPFVVGQNAPMWAGLQVPRPRFQPSPEEVAGRVLNYMDPLGKVASPSLAESIGSCLPVNSKTRVSLAPTSAVGQVFIYNYNFTQYRCYSFAHNALALVRHVTPQINSAVPEQVRFARASLRIRNVSRNDSREGVVRVLSLPNNLDWAFTATTRNMTTAFRDEILSMVESHPKSVSYTADDFASTQRLIIPNASAEGQKEWNTYVGSYGTIDEETAALHDDSAHMVANTVIVYFKATASTTNNYDISVDEQDLCRFNANELLSNLSREPSKTTANAVARRSSVLQSLANKFHVPAAPAPAGGYGGGTA
jgi:hypothetical protein